MNDTLDRSSSSTSVSASPESKIAKERDNDATKLPTPPPDPKKEESNQEILDKERELLEYLISLQQCNNNNNQTSFARSDSIFGPAIAVEEAFDHLQKLYKLMEQFLNLRQQNARLQRRVRDLEYLRNLERMNRNVEVNVEHVSMPNVEEETALAENLFDSLLAIGKKDDKLKTWNQSRFRQSLLRKQRGRRISVSIGENKNQQQNDPTRPRRASASYQPSKISKWTKVKAAFKWEKASNNVSNAKSQDSGIGSIQPINCEVARYLRVPSASEEPGTSPGDSGAADGSSPASISTASSIDNLHEERKERQRLDLHPGYGTRKFFYYDNSLQNKDKDNVKRRRRTLSCRSDDIKLDEIVVESSNEDVFEAEESEEDRIPRRVKEKYKEILNDVKNQNKSDSSDRVSRWNRIKKAFLNNPGSPDGDPQISADEETNVFTFKLDECSGNSSGESTLKIQAEIQRNYEQLQKKLSQEFQIKLQEWEKMKSHSPNVYSEEQKDEAFLKKMEEWQRIKSHPSKLQAIEMMKQENLPPDFKKKLQEWQRIKKISTKDEPMPSSSSSNLVVPSRSKKKPNLLLLPDETTWKQTKLSLQDNISSNITPPISPTKFGKKIKEFTWLEKELGKIDKEKQRLEREKQKFMEREQRLTKLGRSVMGNGNKKEIFIHTPSGFHRFEGISKKFTQKLYEWEKSQGIGPESSTIALLSSGLGLSSKSYFIDQQSTPFNSCGGVTLKRSKSDDSLMVNNLNGTISHQPSSLSLNHVEELERECMLPVTESSLDDDIFTNDRNIDEPEAIIVEVEDIVEETASPLEERPKEKLFPIYHRQPDDKIWPCKSHQIAEKNISPKYDRLTKDISKLISEISEIDKKNWEEKIEDPLKEGCDGSSLTTNNIAKQLLNTEAVLENLEALKLIIDDTRTPQRSGIYSKHLTNVEESIQQLLEKITIKVGDLKDELTEKLDASNIRTTEEQQKDIPDKTTDINNIIGDLKRYIDCIIVAGSGGSENAGVDDKERQDQVKQGAIKKRFRLKPMVSKNEDATDESDEENDRNVHLIRNSHRARTTSDSKTRWKRSKVQENEKMSNVIPSENSAVSTAVVIQTTKKVFDFVTDKKNENEENMNDGDANENKYEKSSSVPSFSYLKRSSNTRRLPPLPLSPNSQRKTPKEISPCIRLMMNRYNQKVSEQDVHSLKSAPRSGSASPVAWRSPLSEKRVKVQTQKYLMELKKQTSPQSQVQKSASVGQLRTLENDDINEKLQSLQKSEGKISRSMSASIIQNVEKSTAKNDNNEQQENLREEKKVARPTCLKLNIIPYEREKSDSRSYRLKKSREDFLASPNINTTSRSQQVSIQSPDPLSAPVVMETGKTIVYPSKNRLSQVSVESESSCDSTIWHGILMKSASAGMINIDADSYKQFDAAAFHRDGYVSLPRSPKKTKQDNFLINSKSALANIASKFRKVKMRRHNKDNRNKKNMNTITALCRQSLVVDINSETSSQSNSEQSSRKSSVLASSPGEKKGSVITGLSCPASEETMLLSSNSSHKENKWMIKRPKFFTKYNQ